MFEAEARQSENHINNLSYRQNSVANEYNVNPFGIDIHSVCLWKSGNIIENIEGVKHRYKNDEWMKVINYDYDIVT
jgi:hypothetical protein